MFLIFSTSIHGTVSSLRPTPFWSILLPSSSTKARSLIWAPAPADSLMILSSASSRDQTLFWWRFPERGVHPWRLLLCSSQSCPVPYFSPCHPFVTQACPGTIGVYGRLGVQRVPYFLGRLCRVEYRPVRRIRPTV